MQARQPIVWSAVSAEGAAAVPHEAAAATEPAIKTAAEPANADATETDTPAEASEEEKRKARAKKFGVNEPPASPKVTEAAVDAVCQPIRCGRHSGIQPMLNVLNIIHLAIAASQLYRSQVIHWRGLGQCCAGAV